MQGLRTKAHAQAVKWSGNNPRSVHNRGPLYTLSAVKLGCDAGRDTGRTFLCAFLRRGEKEQKDMGRASERQQTTCLRPDAVGTCKSLMEKTVCRGAVR